LDVLSALQTEDVVLGLSGELDPAILRPAQDKGSTTDYLSVVMPMRI
jgi:DNA polymerase-3 subunit beta